MVPSCLCRMVLLTRVVAASQVCRVSGADAPWDGVCAVFPVTGSLERAVPEGLRHDGPLSGFGGIHLRVVHRNNPWYCPEGEEGGGAAVSSKGTDPGHAGVITAERAPVRLAASRTPCEVGGEDAGASPVVYVKAPILKDRGFRLFCSLNGNRTRISALRGPRPKPLDDKATPCVAGVPPATHGVLPRKDSNLDKQIQSLLSCR